MFSILLQGSFVSQNPFCQGSLFFNVINNNWKSVSHNFQSKDKDQKHVHHAGLKSETLVRMAPCWASQHYSMSAFQVGILRLLENVYISIFAPHEGLRDRDNIR